MMMQQQNQKFKQNCQTSLHKFLQLFYHQVKATSQIYRGPHSIRPGDTEHTIIINIIITFVIMLIIIIIIIATRPKPPSGRQGLAGSWGKDTVRQVHYKMFSTSHFAPTALSSDLNQPEKWKTIKSNLESRNTYMEPWITITTTWNQKLP